ncbi:MAG TPA: glycosyltransferase, partial [Pyrinomonadaceae bacterium]|nr:glycosyltransferase [Pyrinomonadaceae bacterium]
MSFTVNFIERRDRETGSIETVFSQIGQELERRGVKVMFEKLPYGNDAAGMIKNLAFFKPKPADIFHITGHAHHISLRLPPERTVLTVHDLGILNTRRGLRRWILKKLLFDLPVRRLNHITAISENTKRELVEQTQCAENEIRVIGDPLPASLPQQPKKFSPECPTILQVGTAPNKNLENLARALKDLNCRLRVIGSINSGQEELLRN